MIDTHTHLYVPEFSDCGGAAAVDRALESGVEAMILPNIDVDSIEALRSLHASRPDSTYMAMGLHPTELGDDLSASLSRIEEELFRGGYIAVGEVGIDLHWDTSRLSEQKEAFRTQLRWARRLGLPVIIHSRDAFRDTSECLRAEGMGLHPLVLHSFTGGVDDVRFMRRSVPDAYFGINGVVTYKNAASVREAVVEIGLDRILLETDSPYLAPVPYRGKRNESSYLGAICSRIAETLGVSAAEVEAATDANARALFGLR